MVFVEVGSPDGAEVGSSDGLRVAGGDGSNVGREVGEQLGDALGKSVGNAVGLGVVRFPIQLLMGYDPFSMQYGTEFRNGQPTTSEQYSQNDSWFTFAGAGGAAITAKD